MNTARIKTPANWQSMRQSERDDFLAFQLRRMADAVKYAETFPDRNLNGNTIAIKIKVKS